MKTFTKEDLNVGSKSGRPCYTHATRYGATPGNLVERKRMKVALNEASTLASNFKGSQVTGNVVALPNGWVVTVWRSQYHIKAKGNWNGHNLSKGESLGWSDAIGLIRSHAFLNRKAWEVA